MKEKSKASQKLNTPVKHLNIFFEYSTRVLPTSGALSGH